MQTEQAFRAIAAVGRETTQATGQRELVDALCDGLEALGAEGISLGVRRGDTFSTLDKGFEQSLTAGYAELPSASALPGPDAARSNRGVYLTNVASTIDRYPAAEEILKNSHSQSAACLPLRCPAGTYGYLAVHYASRSHFSDNDKAMLELMATATSGALARLTSQPGSATAVEAEAPTEERSPADCLASLSPREVQVLTAILAGSSNAELARDTHLSINSIKSYIRGAYRKIGVETRTQAVLWGAHHGLLRDLPDAAG